MKKISLFLFGMLMFGSVAHAGIGILEDGSYEGETGAINCSTGLDCTQSGNTTTVAVDAALSVTTSVTVPILTSTYYVTVPYYSRLTMIGSGAPVGSLIQRGGPASGNCGIGGDGTTVYVCQSDGTNWRVV